MSEFPADTLAGRIEKRLETLAIKPTTASREATGKDDAIRKIFTAAREGVAFNPRMDTLQGLARVLGTSTDWLTTGVGPESVSQIDELGSAVPLSDRRVPYGGTVRAGGWLPLDEYFNQDDGDHMVPSSVTRHPDFPELEQRAWLVRGDSLDLVGIREGMWVVAALYLDYVEKIGDPENGQYVIVERSRHGGSEIERTVKELQYGRGLMRFIPRSSNPVHKEFSVPLDFNTDADVVTVKVLAVVLAAVTDYSRRTRKAMESDMPDSHHMAKRVRSKMARA